MMMPVARSMHRDKSKSVPSPSDSKEKACRRPIPLRLGFLRQLSVSAVLLLSCVVSLPSAHCHPDEQQRQQQHRHEHRQEQELEQQQWQQCSVAPIEFDPTQHKSTYRIGVLAIRGFDAAYSEFNRTFSDYLTATAGRRFDPPITFELKPLNFNLLFTDVADQVVDLIYVNPSAYSCIESEYGAESLVSQISRRSVGGSVYHLTKFGGVIAVRADSDIRTLRDLRGRTVAAANIAGLGSGQMQFREMQGTGMSYINDPRQLVFTSNQGKVVNGVLKGEFDVGFVRTDQIERTKDATTGELVDPTRLRIINVQDGLDIDGEPFPFVSSTPLYAEWNVAALTGVPSDVSVEVQGAMLSLAHHATVGFDLLDCYERNNCSDGDASIFGSQEACEAECLNSVDFTAGGKSCDTTLDLALLAADAKDKGKYSGWRSTLSYMDLRNMQEETNFIRRDDADNKMKCVRASNIYDAIVCPPGHIRKPEAEVKEGCELAGLPCKDGFQCLCRPCKKAFDVDVFPIDGDYDAHQYMTDPTRNRNRNRNRRRADDNNDEEDQAIGCPKMGLCGITEQTKPIRYRAIDNKKRPGLQMTVQVHAGQSGTKRIYAEPIGGNASFSYEFEVAEDSVGIVILEVLADGEQIPESPFRLEITDRMCAEDYGDPLRVATADGGCTCKENSVEIGGRCVSYAILLPAIIIPIMAVLGIALYFYIERKRKLSDSVWEVKRKELEFSDPPEIIGRGTFGLVVLAEYRGTSVAVKRVIPPKVRNINNKNAAAGKASRTGSSSGSVIRRNSLLGTGDSEEFEKASRRRSSFDFDEDELENGQYSRPGTRSTDSAVSLTNSAKSAYSGYSAQRPAAVEAMNGGCDSSVVSGMESGMMMSGSMSITSSIANSSATASGVVKRKSSLGGRFRRSSTSNSDGKSTTWWDRQFRYRDEYSKLKSEFIVEMRYLSKLRHPCITTVMGAVIEKGEEPMLVMEYMDHGSLYDMLHNETFPLDGDLLLPILRDIAQGLRFLHAAKPIVIHGDLKAQNVLVDSKFRAKVADFGLSAKKTIGATGTPLWMAPELLRGESPNTAASDVYSFGIILYEVYSRKDPYQGEKLSDVLRDIADPEINKRPPVPPACPPQVASIMTDCLVGDPDSRPTFEEIDLRLKRLDSENVEPGEMHLSAQARKSMRAARDEDLLFRVFPQHVAEALRDGRKVEPENKENVTIFFSDIVGFTDISNTLSPEKVSDMLDRLYLAFDDLSHEHDIFKIETIGDAYLCVTNLVKDQEEDHVKRIAEFAVDAIKVAGETLINSDDPAMGYVQIRVGFHSGPVIASVVGSRLPKYSIFGDTVNTASRMESNSLTGRIQCSERSAMLLMKQCPDMPIVSRGNIRVKGKGEMHTFWVNESKEEVKQLDDGVCELQEKPQIHKVKSGLQPITEEQSRRRSSEQSRRRSSMSRISSAGSVTD